MLSEFLRIFLILLVTYIAASQSMTWLSGGYWMAWRDLIVIAVPVSLLQAALFYGWWWRGKGSGGRRRMPSIE